MPLKSGYSYEVIRENIAELLRAGTSRNSAIAQSYAAGRVSYFQRHPNGALPGWLAFPSHNRLRAGYNKYGAPIPVTGHNRNPVPSLRINPQRENLTRAAHRFTRFTGNTDVSVRKISVPASPRELLAIGPCDGILYSTVRDGVGEKYIHRFRSKSRPLLAATPDGKRLYLLGGAYTFTDRGIVDKKR